MLLVCTLQIRPFLHNGFRLSSSLKLRADCLKSSEGECDRIFFIREVANEVPTFV